VWASAALLGEVAVRAEQLEPWQEAILDKPRVDDASRPHASPTISRASVPDHLAMFCAVVLDVIPQRNIGTDSPQQAHLPP
jgi:hypothetical protein